MNVRFTADADVGGKSYKSDQTAEVSDAEACALIARGAADATAILDDKLVDLAVLPTFAEAAIAEIKAASSPQVLEDLRVRYFGKQGVVSLLTKKIGKVPEDVRKKFGEAVNIARKSIQEKLDERKASVGSAPKPRGKAIDVTLPGIRTGVGRRHPLVQTMEQVKSVLIGLGFRYDDYPEIETEHHNFDALNTPHWHPSRDMHDTFYTKQGDVLRTHTSAFQSRAMKALAPPPIRAITAGRCYRNDEIDATHYPMFHQLDAIAIDRGISFADLKWTLQTLLQTILGKDIKLRFRPSYFPFTTPSAEVDVFYRNRWMELLGSGMMRPEVLEHGGIDSEKYQGFAFGMGMDRLTMARLGINDIRLLYSNEEAFLSQF